MTLNICARAKILVPKVFLYVIEHFFREVSAMFVCPNVI